MRVLVTGATGLIGRETAIALGRSGHDVVALSRRGTPIEGSNETIAADLLDPAAICRAVDGARAEALVHLAWYDGPGRMGAVENLDWVAATIGLVRAFAAAGGRRVVAAGSCAEYDWRDDGPFTEDSPLRPQSIYGVAKARTGQMLTEAALALGLSIVWPRIFFVYGPREPEGRLLGDLIAGLRARREVPCTDGIQERDFLATPDIAAALVHLLEVSAEGPVNVASGQSIPVRDLITAAAEALGAPDLIRLGARARPVDDPTRILANTDRLASLGFRPKFDLAEGMADAIRRTP